MKNMVLVLVALSFAFGAQALTTKDLGKIDFEKGLEQVESDMYAKEYQRSVDDSVRQDSSGVVTLMQAGSGNTKYDPETQTLTEK